MQKWKYISEYNLSQEHVNIKHYINVHLMIIIFREITYVWKSFRCSSIIKLNKYAWYLQF